ncbi:MAG: transposase, partial [Thermoplasmata archaeon]
RAFARKEGMRLHALEVMPDHVHAFLEVPPCESVASVTADVIEHYILESQGMGRRSRPSIRRPSPVATMERDVQSTLDAFAS